MEFAETIAERLVCLAGLTLFACWLLRTSLGRKALADSSPRRNNMPAYMPIVPFLIWFGPVPLAMIAAGRVTGHFEAWQSSFLDRLIYCAGAMLTIALIVFLVRATFARRLKGFGLNIKTVHKDFLAAFVNLLTVWPLVTAAMILTISFSKLIWGAEYEMQHHQELELIAEYSQLPLRVLIAVATIVAAPVVEEMLFRGLFQTMIRSYLKIQNSAWPAIAISSGLFAVIHQNPGHWPALFMLGACMGYAYEKSGSLLRPIFIHALFNATSIIVTLNQ